MKMQYVREELFHFLEQSPYFYEKAPVVKKQRSDEILVNNEDELTHVTYIFFDQENPYQTIGEISIPIINPREEVNWKFIQLDDKERSKPLFQSKNPEIEKMPDWFKSLLIEVRNLYDRIVSLFRIFAPNN